MPPRRSAGLASCSKHVPMVTPLSDDERDSISSLTLCFCSVVKAPFASSLRIISRIRCASTIALMQARLYCSVCLRDMHSSQQRRAPLPSVQWASALLRCGRRCVVHVLRLCGISFPLVVFTTNRTCGEWDHSVSSLSRGPPWLRLCRMVTEATESNCHHQVVKSVSYFKTIEDDRAEVPCCRQHVHIGCLSSSFKSQRMHSSSCIRRL